MTKSELIEKVSARLVLPVSQAEAVVNSTCQTSVTSLVAGRRFKVRGFGVFGVREHESFVGRNLVNGAPNLVASKKPSFSMVGVESRSGWGEY